MDVRHEVEEWEEPREDEVGWELAKADRAVKWLMVMGLIGSGVVVVWVVWLVVRAMRGAW